MPVYNSQFNLSQSKDLIEMARNATDILKFVGDIQALAQTSQANQDALASQKVTLDSVVSTAVVVKEFTIPKASFVAGLNGVYEATLNHGMNSLSPIVAVYDNGSDGKGSDLQLVQVTSKDEDTSVIQLTAFQYNDADFPFQVKVADRIGLGVDIRTSGVAVPMNAPWFARYNPILNGGTVERSNDGGLGWGIVNDGSNIAEAKLASDGTLHIKTKDNLYFFSSIVNGSWQGSNSGNYDGLGPWSNAIAL